MLKAISTRAAGFEIIVFSYYPHWRHDMLVKMFLYFGCTSTIFVAIPSIPKTPADSRFRARIVEFLQKSEATLEKTNAIFEKINGLQTTPAEVQSQPPSAKPSAILPIP
jgi:hypothetical protein